MTPERRAGLRRTLEQYCRAESISQDRARLKLGIPKASWVRIFHRGPAIMRESTFRKLHVPFGFATVADMFRAIDQAASDGHRDSAQSGVPFRKELKTCVRSADESLSRSLLALDLAVPSFVDVVQRADEVTLTQKEKHMGTVGSPPYRHFLQYSVVVTIATGGERLLLCHNRVGNDCVNTRGNSVLLSRSMAFQYRQEPSPLDAWVPMARRSPREGCALFCKDAQGGWPVALRLMQERIRIPERARLSSVRPACVITNDQRGTVGRDGSARNSVYTSYVMHLDFAGTGKHRVEPQEFAGPISHNWYSYLPCSVDDGQLRYVLSDPEDDARINGMDYLMARWIARGGARLRYEGKNGNVTLVEGFVIA